MTVEATDTPRETTRLRAGSARVWNDERIDDSEARRSTSSRGRNAADAVELPRPYQVPGFVVAALFDQCRRRDLRRVTRVIR